MAGNSSFKYFFTRKLTESKAGRNKIGEGRVYNLRISGQMNNPGINISYTEEIIVNRLGSKIKGDRGLPSLEIRRQNNAKEIVTQVYYLRSERLYFFTGIGWNTSDNISNKKCLLLLLKMADICLIC